jgi:hypothetical protein
MLDTLKSAWYKRKSAPILGVIVPYVRIAYIVGLCPILTLRKCDALHTKYPYFGLDTHGLGV